MSIEQESKNLSVACIHIGFSAVSNIARALRGTLEAIKNANVKWGEEHYKDYLKDSGIRFKSDKELARMAAIVKNTDIERYTIKDDDLKVIDQMAKKWGMDYSITRKPDDLDRLIKKKFIDEEPLNSQEEKIVRAFTFRDKDNKTMMDPENPSLPLISDDEYMLTICSKDLIRWEHICRELESRTHEPKLKERLKDAIVASKTHNDYFRNIAKAIVKTKEKEV